MGNKSARDAVHGVHAWLIHVHYSLSTAPLCAELECARYALEVDVGQVTM